MRWAFVSSVVETPEDDTPRLVFADWLEENGEPERGEFIRVQCELVKTQPVFCVAERPDQYGGFSYYDEPNPHYEALRCRSRELLEAHYIDWIKQVHPNGFTCTFRRGFVAEITCKLADWCGTECKRCEGTILIYSPRLDNQRRTRGGRPVTVCPACHGTGRVGGHGPALVRAAPLERVTLTEWRGDVCYMCCRGSVPTDRDDNTCEVCHGLYNSTAALAWAKQHG